MNALDTTDGLEAGPAVFSDDRKYRYSLTRTWDESKGAVTYIGLNPSTADEVTLDRTLRRCLDFARNWGFGTFHMVNLFAFRATEPDDMKRELAPIGPDNDEEILRRAVMSDLIVAAWGVHGSWMERDRAVFCLLKKRGYRLDCFGLTKDGHPKHPLYLHHTTELVNYQGLRF